MEDRHPNFPAATYNIITQQIILNPNDGYVLFRISVLGIDYFLGCYLDDNKFRDINIFEKTEKGDHISPNPMTKNIIELFFNFHINHYDYRQRLEKVKDEINANCITISND